MSEKKGLHVLLVEDNDDDVIQMQDVFEETELVGDFTHVGDGEAAIAYLRGDSPYESGDRPDMVLLDLGLPKIDGFGVLEAMRKSAELSEIPVVIFTQSQAEQDVVQSYNLGACSFLSKPVNVERFEEIVRGFSIYWDAMTQFESA